MLLALESHATLRIWTGGGVNNLWNNGANWSSGVPVTGDDLLFQGGATVDATSLNNTNNFPVDTVFGSITILGTNYIFNGNEILFTNTGIAISAQNTGGANTFNIPFLFNAANQTFECTVSTATLNLVGNINLNGRNLTNTATGRMNFSGVISGAGDFVKNGAGTLLLGGAVANTYTGITRVNGGTLELDDTSVSLTSVMVPGDLTIANNATVLILDTDGNQIADTANVAITSGGIFNGLLNVNGQNETIGSLTLIGGGDVTTGIGTLTVNGNITASADTLNAASISGNLNLGAASRIISANDGAFLSPPGFVISANISGGAGVGFTKTGTGGLRLSGVNTYTGVTTISNGLLHAATTSALGGAAGGTALSGGNLIIESVTIANEWLTNSVATSKLQASGVTAGWSSNVVLNADLEIQPLAATLLDLSGVISGAGGITKSQTGTLRLSGTSNNPFTGATFVDEGVLELSKVNALLSTTLLTIGDGVGGIGADVVRYLANDGINSSIPILINESGLLDLNGFSDTVGALTLVGGDISTGVGTLTMANNMVATSTSAGSVADITGNIAISGTRTFTVTNGPITPDVQLSAVVSGGSMIKAGNGNLSLNSPNTFTGSVTVNDGVLRLTDNLAVGTVAGGVIVNSNATVEVFSNTHIGAEPLTLNSTNNILGALEGLSGSNSWAGPITLSRDVFINVDVGDTLNLLGSIDGAAGVTKIDTGTLYYSGGTANTYTGTTFVNAGTLVLAKSIFNSSIVNNLVIGDGAGTDVVRIELTSQLPNTTAVTINSSGLLDVFGTDFFGSLAGSGDVVLHTADIQVGVDNNSTLFTGIISGPGNFSKVGNGTMTLSGNNTFDGSTTVTSGTLLVNGSQPQSPVSVGAAGTLGGSGTVGHISNLAGGIVAPGSSTGMLTSSNATFSGVTSDFTVELTGAAGGIPGVTFDQLNARGTVTLGGATLNVVPNFAGLGAPTSGDRYTIIANDGGDAVVGTFAGLVDNAIFTAGGMAFRIDYDGGSGNDVTLTFTNPALASLGGFVTSGNGNGVIDPDECNLLYVVITNTGVDTTTGIQATLLPDSQNISVLQPVSSYANIPAGGKGTNALPFQISTTPGFTCGSNIAMKLILQTANHGTYSVPVTLTSGSAGSPVGFVNNVATAVPDLGSVNRLFNVVGITAPLARVEVSMQISHTSDADLDVFLIGPDATSVELTTDNGGTFDDYGADCTEGNRTRFSDLAATAITAGTPPFVGTFRPEGSLSAFIGKSGAAVNGVWTLQVSDDSAGGLGTINCASLFMYPAACSPGSGACQLCPDVIIAGATGPASTPQQNYISFSGIPSTCGVPAICPGSGAAVGLPSDNYTFQNGPSNACITVTLENTSPIAGMLVTAYTNSYNPAAADKCINFLAEGGNIVSANNPSQTFSFNLSPNAIFVINIVASDPISAPYRLTVSGGQCRPLLNVTPIPGNRAVLDWTTSAVGYGLETTNALVNGGSPIWPGITNVPRVISGRFTVTNTVASPTQFYQLRKSVP